jgi:hypothetical protein
MSNLWAVIELNQSFRSTCHPERSEGSPALFAPKSANKAGILRPFGAQNDNHDEKIQKSLN